MQSQHALTRTRAILGRAQAQARAALTVRQTCAMAPNAARVVPLRREASRLARPMPQGLRAMATAAKKDGLVVGGAPTRVTRLPSGLTVVSEPFAAPGDASSTTCTVGLWVNSGSRAESLGNNGAAHFLEHMLFKGTSSRSQADLEREIENMGAQLNAYTSREHTVYYAKLFSADAFKGISIIADLLANCTLDARAVEAERSVILRELQEIENNMEETLFDHLHATAFPSSSLGYTILGPRENIKKLTPADLRAYIARNYTPDRMVLVGVGNSLDHDELCKHASSLPLFSRKKDASKSGSAAELVYRPSPADFLGSEVRIRVDDMPTAHMAVAFEGCSWSSPDYWPLQVAACMIGSYDRMAAAYPTTRLAQSVADHALANQYTSFNTSYCDTGLWGIYMTSNARAHLDDLMHWVGKAWMRLCTQPSETELVHAKQTLKSSLLLRLDGTTALAEEIGLQMLTLGKRQSASEVAAAIDSVTQEDVKRVAQKYVYDRDPAIAALGPIEGFPDYNQIRASLNLLRY